MIVYYAALALLWSAPPSDITVPPMMICKSGGAMSLELGPTFDIIHYKVVPGLRPPDPTKLEPGACTSGTRDVPLGRSATPMLRYQKHAVGTPENVGFSARYAPGGRVEVSAVFQPPCKPDECRPSPAQKELQANLQRLLDALERPGTLFEVGVVRSPDLDVAGPVMTWDLMRQTLRFEPR